MPGSGFRFSFHFSFEGVVANLGGISAGGVPARPRRVEGARKCLSQLGLIAEARTGIPLGTLPVGLAGVWNWRGRVGKVDGPDGTRLDEKGLVNDFTRITFEDREVTIWYDRNVHDNPDKSGSVSHARNSFAKELRSLGANVRFCDLPADDVSVNGPDDYAAMHGLAAALCAAFAIAAWAQPPVAGVYDVIIRGGRVVDGTGNPWFAADVAIKGGRIAAVSNTLTTATAARVIDAAGLVVAPGFIDLHTHSDTSLLADANAQSKVRQGVTIYVLGESTSVAPRIPPATRRGRGCC